MGDHQVVHFLAEIARIAKAQMLSDRVTGNVRLISLTRADELLELLSVFDVGRINLLKKGDGAIGPSIPQPMDQVLEHLVAKRSSLHRQAQLHLAFLDDVIPV